MVKLVPLGAARQLSYEMNFVGYLGKDSKPSLATLQRRLRANMLERSLSKGYRRPHPVEYHAQSEPSPVQPLFRREWLERARWINGKLIWQ